LLGATDLTNPSLRVIADHIRACSFLVVDGVIPSNEGRGYVLRRIARRAMRHGHKFGKSPTFFNELVPTLVKVMGGAFPDWSPSRLACAKCCSRKASSSSARSKPAWKSSMPRWRSSADKTIDGETVFKLLRHLRLPRRPHRRHRARARLSIDSAGYEARMQAQREHRRPPASSAWT
jgi:alanyl-tRNA synthetase